MSIPFWRTGLVDISDAELIVLDALADYGALRLVDLSDPAFDLHLNCRPHGLDESTLTRMLTQWRRLGWIKPIIADDGERFELTPSGGLQWERERAPDWSRWVHGHRRFLGRTDDRWIETYFGNTASTVDTCFRWFVEIEGTTVVRTRRAIVRHRIWEYPWKSQGPFFAVVAVVASAPEINLLFDWQRYEDSRCWWRDTSEIMRSRALIR